MLNKPAELIQNCKHTHTFSAPIQNATWYVNGERQGQHESLVLRGCYLCGKVEVYDYKQ